MMFLEMGRMSKLDSTQFQRLNDNMAIFSPFERTRKLISCRLISSCVEAGVGFVSAASGEAVKMLQPIISEINVPNPFAFVSPYLNLFQYMSCSFFCN